MEPRRSHDVLDECDGPEPVQSPSHPDPSSPWVIYEVQDPNSLPSRSQDCAQSNLLLFDPRRIVKVGLLLGYVTIFN